MPAVEKCQKSRAKGHDQNPSFFFIINFRVIIQTYFFDCLVLISSRLGNNEKTCI